MDYEMRAKQAPCKEACPVGIDVPRYVRFISKGQFAEALAVIGEKMPFASVCGYVCPRPCETKCHLFQLGGAVPIRALKRFVADRGKSNEAQPVARQSGKKVAIVGAGPAGLTAAYYLAKIGHAVTVFEATSKSGGMMRLGIPRYELPEEILNRDIDNILAQGIELNLNSPVEKVEQLIDGKYDAVFLAPGLSKGLKLNIPGAKMKQVLTGVEFLRDINQGKEVSVGQKVLVLGGGGVGFDAARSALRLGASEVHVACLESRDSIPAHPEVVAEAEQEGVIVHPSLSFCRIVGEREATGVECLDVRSMRFDEEGKLHLETVPGSEHVLKADTVIFAVGQGIDPGLVSGIPELGLTGRSTIAVDKETMATGRKGVFAGGDVVNGPSSVVESIDTGRRAAIAIDKYLGGTGNIDETLSPPEGEPLPSTSPGVPVGVGKRTPTPLLSVDQRLAGFDKTELPLPESLAVEQAKRCLRCDLPITVDETKCVGCMTCRLRCSLRFEGASQPSRSAIQVLPTHGSDREFAFKISFGDRCDTCGLCVQYCPSGALAR